MTIFVKTITLSLLSFISVNADVPQQQSKLHKRWRIVADETIFLNLDGTPHLGYKNRMDSVRTKDAFFEFLPNGDFRSVEGDGTFVLAGDSVHLHITGQSSFKYVLKDSSLYLYSDSKRESHIRREVLHAKAL